MKVTITPLDTTNYPNWWLDSEITKYMLHGSCTRGPEYNTEYYEKIKNSNGAIRVWKIMVSFNGEKEYHVGNCSLSGIDLIHRRAELGIVIWNCRGMGIGKEACRLMCEWGFKNLGLHTIWLGVLEDNKAAQMCYMRIGFVIYGTARDACFKDGRFTNVVYMQLTEGSNARRDN